MSGNRRRRNRRRADLALQMIDQPSSSYSARDSSSAQPMLPPAEDNVKIGVSRGLRQWLVDNRTSFAVSSYQSGRLILVGAMADGNVSIHQQRYDRVMGICWSSDPLYLAARQFIWLLEQ